VKIQVARVGKNTQAHLVPIVNDYRKRLSSFIKVDEIEVKSDPQRDKRSLAKVSKPIYQPSSGEFPRIKTVTFLVGPPYGFDDATRKVASVTWSLSDLTVPSDFAWLLVWEQIYRAMTILKGMPYHHD
jgi:23S rRNA (pseudouridine1915-N3)-methyltransferase